MPWIIVGILVILVIGLALKLMGDAAKFNEVRDDRDELKKEVRKLADKTKDMQDKVAQKGAEAGDAKDHKKQVQEAEAAKRAAEAEKKKAADEAAQVLERNRELSNDLNRVRIEKEQQRQELVAARDRLRELGETAAQVQALKAEVARANDAVQAAQAAPVQVVAAPAAPVENDPEREERQSAKLKRELEFTRKAGDRLGTILEQWKDKALESESSLRRTQKKLADTNSVLNITQAQLDLALDEIYILKNGEQPEHPLSDRAKHRAALKPKEPQVEVRRGEVVVLPGAEPKAKVEPDAAKVEGPPSDAAPAPAATAPLSAPVAAPEETKAPEAARAPEAKAEAKPEAKKEPEVAPKAAAAKAKKEPEAPKAEAAKSDSAKTDAAKAPAKTEAKAEGAKTVLRKKDAEPEPAKKAPPRPAKTTGKK